LNSKEERNQRIREAYRNECNRNIHYIDDKINNFRTKKQQANQMIDDLRSANFPGLQQAPRERIVDIGNQIKGAEEQKTMYNRILEGARSGAKIGASIGAHFGTFGSATGAIIGGVIGGIASIFS